jgi:hypothetical protein
MVVLTIEQIQKEVAGFFNIPVEKLSEDTRKRNIVKPRQIAMSLSHEFKTGSDEVIGKSFGRDRTTVIHALKIVKRDYDTNPSYACEFNKIEYILKEKGGIEIWKTIPGLENYYEASTFGRIRALPRVISLKNGIKYKSPEKLISYKEEIALTFKGKRIRRGFLRLIATTWIPNPNNLGFAIKKDPYGNEYIDNIEWSNNRWSEGKIRNFHKSY